MTNARELLNNPAVQRSLVQNADRLFDLERLLVEPTVVFDRGDDDFWVTATNSSKREEIFKRVRSGVLIPINADILGDIASVHTLFHVFLAESGRGIPTIPTFVNVTGSPVCVGRYVPSGEIPGVFVKKVSYDKEGKSLSHRGEGVSIVRVTQDNLRDCLPQTKWELLQPFIVPPDGLVRDIRVYVVDGVPITGLVRQARCKLTAENLSGKVLPSPEQYPSAHHPGPSEHLAGPLRELVFSSALPISKFLSDKVRTRPRPFSPYSTFGFGSIDFLLDAAGVPLPVDFDLNPSVSNLQEVRVGVVRALTEFLAKLADIEGLERKILVIGYGDEFIDDLLVGLRDNPKIGQRIRYEETVLAKFWKETQVLRVTGS